MAEPIPVAELEIVGYAERFSSEMLPAIAPPVYRRTSLPSMVFVPPFREADSLLYGSTAITEEDFEDLIATGQATRLQEAIPAKPAHELWFDEAFVLHYQPFPQATEQLGKIADASIEKAREALCAGRLDEAERFTRTAIRADDGRQEPFAIRAAIRLAQGKSNAVQVMKLLAPPTVGDAAFRVLVEFYSSCLPEAASQPGSGRGNGRPDSSSRPMFGVAASRPYLEGTWAA